MEKFEEQKFGVLGFKIVDDHYVVDIRWKDGRESQHNFPENGFGIYDLDRNRSKKDRRSPIDHLSGKEALEILKNVSPSMNEEDFSWLDYVHSKIEKKAA